MKPQQQEISPMAIGENWRAELNAAESMAGQLRDRLRSLRKSAESEAEKSGDKEVADWWSSAVERLDNGVYEADQISDALCVLDDGLPEFSRP